VRTSNPNPDNTLLIHCASLRFFLLALKDLVAINANHQRPPAVSWNCHGLGAMVCVTTAPMRATAAKSPAAAMTRSTGTKTNELDKTAAVNDPNCISTSKITHT